MGSLYRGVSLETHHLGLALTPKGTGPFEGGLFYDAEPFAYDMGFTYDKSMENALIPHQLDSSKYPSSGISTTPHFERAVHYALNGGKRSQGVVYELEATALKAAGVLMIPVVMVAVHANVPEDDEIVLVASAPGPLVAPAKVHQVASGAWPACPSPMRGHDVLGRGLGGPGRASSGWAPGRATPEKPSPCPADVHDHPTMTDEGGPWVGVTGRRGVPT